VRVGHQVLERAIVLFDLTFTHRDQDGQPHALEAGQRIGEKAQGRGVRQVRVVDQQYERRFVAEVARLPVEAVQRGGLTAARTRVAWSHQGLGRLGGSTAEQLRPACHQVLEELADTPNTYSIST
jgi:hypothetical protein